MSTLTELDIGANLTDGMFRGLYHGRQVHAPDLRAVLGRAQEQGVERILVLAGSLPEVREAVTMIRSEELGDFRGMLGTTVGVHPTRVNELASDAGYLEELLAVARRHRELGIQAVGEFGLGRRSEEIMTMSGGSISPPPPS